MKTAIAILLIVLGVWLIYLSIVATILPPALTGIGFLGISILLLSKKN
ncbi:hypothetical protein [Aegicerativicinus sediminis]|nr:hypothetical protein [Aegicerativicinus sediminis]